MDRLRRHLNIQFNNKHTNPKFINSQQRLENRENAFFRRAEIQNRKTFRDVKESRKLKGKLINVKF